jgi:large subunit ribosomal protein L25
MATVKLKVARREARGKQGAKRLRAGGNVPAVLYGEKQENVPILIDAKALHTALSTRSGRNVIIQIDMEEAETATRAVIRDMERHPVSREILHVDLQRISEDHPVIMHVPVVLKGESPAVKEGRGILDHAMRELEVKCLPRYIPEHIEVDVSTLEARHAIHVADIEMPNIEILDNPERPVVEVLQPTIYREPVAEVAEAAEGGEEGGEAAEGAEGEGEAETKSPKE